MVREEVTVYYQGRVQGVGFRATVKQISNAYDVVGFVKNETNESVKVVVVGESKECARFLAAIKASRLGPLVSNTSEIRRPTVEEYALFEIRHW